MNPHFGSNWHFWPFLPSLIWCNMISQQIWRKIFFRFLPQFVTFYWMTKKSGGWKKNWRSVTWGKGSKSTMLAVKQFFNDSFHSSQFQTDFIWFSPWQNAKKWQIDIFVEKEANEEWNEVGKRSHFIVDRQLMKIVQVLISWCSLLGFHHNMICFNSD